MAKGFQSKNEKTGRRKNVLYPGGGGGGPNPMR